MFATLSGLYALWKTKALAAWALSKAKIGIYALVALAVVIAGGFIYAMGASSERGKCSVAALRSQIAALQKDLDTIRKAAADDRDKAIKLDALTAQQAVKLREYEDELAKRPDRCVLRDDDARRLR